MSNICEQCGGQKVLYYKVEAICANNYTSPVLATTNSSMKVCTCPIPRPKHDGKIGSDDNVYLVQYMLKQRPRYASVWIGRDTELRQDEIWLSPEQALSLLNWLKQEEDQLIQMAKERE